MHYTITLPNIIFGHLVPPEDALLTSGRVFCVADGVTRDPHNLSVLRKKETVDTLKKGYYPNPSPARLASDVFCENFEKFLRNRRSNENNIKQAFQSSNRAIGRLNKSLIKKVDYLVNDFGGCAAVGGVIQGKKLYWGNVNNCLAVVFSRKGKIKFQTPDEDPAFRRYLSNKGLLSKWYDPKVRRFVRGECRNNVERAKKTRHSAYGVLTGESSVDYFMNFGVQALASGDMVVFHTDGFENYIKQKEFFKILYQGSMSLIEQKFIPYSQGLAKKNADRYGKERTLIATIVK